MIEEARLRKVILDALSAPYTGRSCKDDIVTGNHYQSVSLGDSTVSAGFRGSRREVLGLFDFTDSTVLDVGSNLGEIARCASAGGARHVIGVEYDAYFILVANLLNLLNHVEEEAITFEQTDITKHFKFDREYDYVLAFSVFTYIGARLKEIADSTSRALLVETHNVGPGEEDKYVRSLTAHFSSVVRLGESDWGAAEQFAGGRRVFLACFKNKREAWKVFDRCQKSAPTLSSLATCDLMQSDIPALRQLKARGIPAAEKLRAMPRDTPAYRHFGESVPASLSEYTYWIDFYRGILDMQNQGGTVSVDNPYVALLGEIVTTGHMFDPGAMRSFQDPNARLERARWRLQAANSATAATPMMFDVAGQQKSIKLQSVDGRPIVGTAIDGYHRLAAAMFAGRYQVPMYSIPVYGEL